MSKFKGHGGEIVLDRTRKRFKKKSFTLMISHAGEIGIEIFFTSFRAANFATLTFLYINLVVSSIANVDKVFWHISFATNVQPH